MLHTDVINVWNINELVYQTILVSLEIDKIRSEMCFHGI